MNLNWFIRKPIDLSGISLDCTDEMGEYIDGSQRGRAQSSALGVMLVFAIVIAGSTLTVALGAEAFATTNDQLSSDRAEQAITQLDSKIAMVALGNSRVQQVGIPSSSGYMVNSDSGWMNVTITNTTSGSTTTVFNDTMGEVIYENGDTAIAYQGGGVWRQTETGSSTMVSPPEFHYREATLTLPLVTVSGDDTVDGTVVISQNNSTQYYPNQTLNSEFVNPLENGKVNVTVRSDYYRAWGNYFEERTDGDVVYDHDEQVATLQLTVPAEHPSVDAAVVSGAPSSTMVINNNAGLDSYNSSKGPYNGDLQGGSPNPDETNATITVAGDLEIEHGDVYGDVEVAGDLEFTHNQGELHDGNISYGSNLNPSDPYGDGHWDVPDPATSRFWKSQNASVSTPDGTSGLIADRQSELSDPSTNDNDVENTIDETTDQLDCTIDCTIETGSYYLQSTTVSDDLTFDTSDGDVEIVVDGPFAMDNNVEVEGDGRVNIYVTGSVSTSNGVQTGNTTTDDSTQFWLYMNDDESITLSNNVEFRGVIYGPGSGGSPGTAINLQQNAEIYGALVGDLQIQSNNAEIHYDAAISNTETITSSETLPALTYIHVSTNEVNVTSG